MHRGAAIASARLEIARSKPELRTRSTAGPPLSPCRPLFYRDLETLMSAMGYTSDIRYIVKPLKRFMGQKRFFPFAEGCP